MNNAATNISTQEGESAVHKSVCSKDQLPKAGDLVHNFSILDVTELPEFDAIGVYARHIKSGAEVYHMVNTDSENLFSFGFQTAPTDSSGVAHILEHSVLCGSENYPLKDAFIVLAQGSLQTFLNAMTFPDKTLYPASSTNRQDYFNLMSVYGDAVFRPLLSPWIFRQEGWRLELDEELSPSLNGVVYNEMKGAYSSVESIAAEWVSRSVLPSGPYAHDSGGDPREIPSLTHEDLLAFHREHYCPANCRIFLCGDIDTREQLKFLEEKFFSVLPPGKAAAPIALEPRWSKPRNFVVPAPASQDSSPVVMISWLMGDSTDPDESLLNVLMAETLLGHDGSPLARALVDSGIGEDLAPVCGFDTNLRESLFSLGLRGVPKERIGDFEKLVFKTLGDLIRDGIPRRELEAALLSLEFSVREIRRAHGPFSLVYLRRAMRAWLHGKHPASTLCVRDRLSALRKRLENEENLLEGLIKKTLIDNPHRSLVEIVPDQELAAREERELAERLAKRCAAMSSQERARLQREAIELKAAQEAVESPEQLSCIPHLSRADLKASIETIPQSLSAVSRIPTVIHTVHTNGISYIDLVFPIDTLTAEDYPFLPLLWRFAGSVGLPGLDYGEVSSLMARLMGGFHATVQCNSVPKGTARSLAFPCGIYDVCARDTLVYRMKVLDENVHDALALMHRLICESVYDDERRLKDLLVELRNDVEASLAPGGSSFAWGRVSRRYSRERAIDELWSGFTARDFVRALSSVLKLNKNGDREGAHPLLKGIKTLKDLGSRLVSLRDRIASSGCLIHIASSEDALPGTLSALDRHFGHFGPFKSRNESLYEDEPWFHYVDNGKPGSEVFSSSQLQTGFSALSLRGSRLGSRDYPAELLLSHYLSTAFLWEEVRMKGGAYGASASCDPGDAIFVFTSYRDPDPQRSLKAFKKGLESIATEGLSEALVEKTLIGTYSRETGPRAPGDRAWAELLRLLYGITERHRLKKLEDLISIKSSDVQRAAERVLASFDASTAAVVGGPSQATSAAKGLGVPIRDLD